MNRSERVSEATKLYAQMTSVEQKLSEWPSVLPSPPDIRSRQDLMAVRAQMAAIEHQISLLRLLQSENRLRQQLWIAVPSLLSGIVGTLLLQYFK